MGLSNEAVRVAIDLRLGLELCVPHQCQCGEIAHVAAQGAHHGTGWFVGDRRVDLPAASPLKTLSAVIELLGVLGG